jgi:hypothetical protein
VCHLRLTYYGLEHSSPHACAVPLVSAVKVRSWSISWPQAANIRVTAWSWWPSSLCTRADTTRGLGRGNPSRSTRSSLMPAQVAKRGTRHNNITRRLNTADTRTHQWTWKQFHSVFTATINLLNTRISVMLSSHFLACLPNCHFHLVPKENSICISCIFHPKSFQFRRDYCILETKMQADVEGRKHITSALQSPTG